MPEHVEEKLGSPYIEIEICDHIGRKRTPNDCLLHIHTDMPWPANVFYLGKAELLEILNQYFAMNEVGPQAERRKGLPPG